jgi:hypothetical protein
MPNNVTNLLTVSGDAEDIRKFFEAVCGVDSAGKPIFSEIPRCGIGAEIRD